MKRALIPTFGLAVALGLATLADAQTTTQPTPPPPANQTATGPNFVDANGDGICDYYQGGGRAAGQNRGRGNGPRDGTGNRGVGPRDGTGYGPGPAAGGRQCDGTGPKGQGGRGPRR